MSDFYCQWISRIFWCQSLRKKSDPFNLRPARKQGEIEGDRNYSRILLNFWTDSLVNSMAFLQIFILLSHLLCSGGPSPERSSWLQNLMAWSRWKVIRSSALLFLSFSISIAMPHMVLGRIQVEVSGFWIFLDLNFVFLSTPYFYSKE